MKLLDISDWNTSSNTDFYETFSFAESFNGDLNKWDVSNGMNATFVHGLFYEMFNLSMSNHPYHSSSSQLNKTDSNYNVWHVQWSQSVQH